MARLGLAATAALSTLSALAATLLSPSFSGTARADTADTVPEAVCSVGDPRLAELSGLAADSEHLYAVADGGTRAEVVVLDDDCQVRDVLTAPTDPYDVEDLALGPDATLWLGDTGDNRQVRETVALHALSRDGTSTLYRLTYPDGPHDAEALVVDGEGTPYIITKSAVGSSRVYRPSGPLVSPGPTPLEEVATVSLLPTATQGGPLGVAGSVLVTGAALSPDGSVVALRTYTDAYLYPVTGGDIAGAFGHQPVRVPLPGEPQGEAIAFTPDGTLLSAGEGSGEQVRAIPNATALADDRGSGDRSNATEQAGTEQRAETIESADGEPDLDPVAPLTIAVWSAVALGAVFGVVLVARFHHRRRRRRRR